MKLLRMSKMLCAYSACFALTLSGCLARSEEKKEAEATNEQIEIVVENSMDVEAPATVTDTEKTEAPAEEEKKEEVETTERTTTPPTLKEEKKMTKVVLPSGLAYEILTPAENENAATPVAGRKVTVHYTGWLDVEGQPGKKFDSSVDRNDTFSFVIGAGYVIKGWDLGVMSMRVGEKRRLYIPADLGYGARGAGALIPPNANLIFDVELISVG